MIGLLGAMGYAGFLLLCVAGLVQTASTPDLGAAFGNLWAYAGAIATTAALGAVKGLDTKLTNAPLFRKLQPLITLGGAFGAAALANKTGVTFDPSTLASAPIATVVALTIAELGSLLTKRKS